MRDKGCRFASPGLSGQFQQLIANTKAILAERQTVLNHNARVTEKLCDHSNYLNQLRQIGKSSGEHLGMPFPTLAPVEGLLHAQDTTVITPEAIKTVLK